MADPAWLLRDQCPGKGRGATKHYKCLPTDEICEFQLPEMLNPSVLMLWRLASMQEDALRVVNAWEYTVKSEVVWVKTKPCPRCKGSGRDNDPALKCQQCGGSCWVPHMGLGHHTRGGHETCLICTRGVGLSKLRLNKDVPSVIFAPPPKKSKLIGGGSRAIRHSAKPDRIFEIAELLYPGPYVELFSRKDRDGWNCFGDEKGTR
jgi:N6-adenosine-specific RNA methylase IME4